MVTQGKGWTSVVGGWRCDACGTVAQEYAPHKHACDKKHEACTRLVREHAAAVQSSNIPDITGQLAQHVKAWNHPVKFGEVATKRAIEAYAAYADDYYDSFERELGTDGYFSGYARDMLLAINASLTMGFKSRLDSGCVHRLLIKLAETSGVEWEIHQ